MQQSTKEEVDVHLRWAFRSDSEDFVSLFLLSEPFYQLIFGNRIASAAKKLFESENNLFSFKHVLVADFHSEVAGMLLGYDWETNEREGSRTDLMLLNLVGIEDAGKLKVYNEFNNFLEGFEKEEYYVSNLAVYEKFRGLGIGNALMEMAEEEARKLGARKMVLDVGSENLSALFFYSKLGFKIREGYNISFNSSPGFCFERMEKGI